MKTPRSKRETKAASLTGLVFGISAATALAAGYSSAIKSDGPLAYYQFGDSSLRTNINVNIGSAGSSANATNINVRRIPGAIVGSANPAAYFDSSARTIIPWTADLNPAATTSFTIEAWFYPTSDKVDGSFVGPAPIMNRYSYSGVNRQGWAYFQRNPDSSYSVPGHQSDVGWNFRTYRGSGSSTGINVTSQKPYRLGAWQHVVTVWEASTQTAVIYVDGQPAGTNQYTAGVGYVANTGDHPASEAPNGSAGLCVGSYNNTETGSNPFRGGEDEVAFYSKALTPAQILAHYQNATNANRSVSYDSLIKTDGPVGYWRFDDATPTDDTVVNVGSLQNAGVATNSAEVVHPVASALAGSMDGAQSYHWRNGNSVTTMPWLGENNPESFMPFAVEFWVRPTSDRQSPGACVINNRLSSGAQNRTGWVVFQRAPNDTYAGVSGYEGVGWDFRMYQGAGSASSDVVSQVPYTVGKWQHVACTWDGQSTATIYVDGQPAATNEFAFYTANSNPPQPPDDALTGADLAIGAYNKASGLGSNPFEGDVDEFVIYTNMVLTADQILAHYMAGTNRSPATNYATLVLNAGYEYAASQFLFGVQGSQPATYLRMGDPSFNPVANSGSLGDGADGSRVLTTASAGPSTPGFEAPNSAVSLDGSKSWVKINSSTAMDIVGNITLEAWIKPGVNGGNVERIISHGPLTLSQYDSGIVSSNGVTASSDVALSIDGTGATTNYVVGVGQSNPGGSFVGASFPVPAGDLGGSAWIHLLGTYDGTAWRLYRNGTQVASTTSATGAVSIPGAGWALGAAGNGWANNFVGQIDEAAIYNKALSAASVQGHYSVGLTGPRLTVTKSGSTYLVNWAGGTLQQADAVNGTYSDIAGAPSPYPIPGGVSKKFYRVKY
ncbi:MAG: LamG domain-containing protein [Verrucomicrobiota bacterium]